MSRSIALLLVRLTLGLLFGGAAYSSLAHSNHYAPITALPAGQAPVFWLPPSGAVGTSLYGIACALCAGSLLLGVRPQVGALVGAAVVLAAELEHLLVSPFSNLSTHLLPLLAGCVVLLAAQDSPLGRRPWGLDRWLPESPARWAPGGDWALLSLRLFLGLAFFAQGLYGVRHGVVSFARDVYVTPFTRTGVPAPLLWLAGLANPPIQLLSGLAVAAGVALRITCLVLGAFLVSIVFGHMLDDPLDLGADMHHFSLANLAVLIAILFLRQSRRDRFSLDAWFAVRRASR